jgi:hypothetical protein
MHLFEPIPTHASLLRMTRLKATDRLVFVWLSIVPFLIDASIVFPPDPPPLASPWVLGWKGGESVALPC